MTHDELDIARMDDDGAGHAITTSPAERMQCPDWSSAEITGPDYVMGCGSTDTIGPDDEGLHDCLNCGIWFYPEASPS